MYEESGYLFKREWKSYVKKVQTIRGLGLEWSDQLSLETVLCSWESSGNGSGFGEVGILILQIQYQGFGLDWGLAFSFVFLFAYILKHEQFWLCRGLCFI
jgi:hypothetical protein